MKIYTKIEVDIKSIASSTPPRESSDFVLSFFTRRCESFAFRCPFFAEG